MAETRIGEDIFRECRIYRTTLQELIAALDECNRLGPEHEWAGGATMKLYERVAEARAVLASWNEVWCSDTERRT